MASPDDVRAQILVCFLADVLWMTPAASCRQAVWGPEPGQVFQAPSGIALADVVLAARTEALIRKRSISERADAPADPAPATRPATGRGAETGDGVETRPCAR